MQRHKLHIVSFDVPYPANYGGAIDVFFKIKSLSEAGCEIYLHCFQYGRAQTDELNKYCKKVFYYSRKIGLAGISINEPYIVSSRKNGSLLQNLLAIDAPILFEGLHTTHYMQHPALKSRFKAVRMHNIEYQYYRALAKRESNTFKKIYFNTEANLLKKYEQTLQYAQAIFSLSHTDNEYYSKKFPGATTAFIAPFHPYTDVTSLEGSGDYCIYHGNLSHPENIEAALFLMQNVVPKLDIPFVLAGRDPAPVLSKVAGRLPRCEIISNPSAADMDDLIARAHIHVLPTFQATGMKLKLLYALFAGRHVLVNDDMLQGTGLDNICHKASDAVVFSEKIKSLMLQPFTKSDITLRSKALMSDYNNATNASRLLTYLPQIFP